MVASLSPVSKLLKTAVTSIAHNWTQLNKIAHSCTQLNRITQGQIHKEHHRQPATQIHCTRDGLTQKTDDTHTDNHTHKEGNKRHKHTQKYAELEKCSHLLQLPVCQHLWIVGHVVTHPHLGEDVGFNMKWAQMITLSSAHHHPHQISGKKNTITTTTITDTKQISVWTSVSIGLSSRSSIASYSLFKWIKIKKRWGRGIILVLSKHKISF